MPVSLRPEPPTASNQQTMMPIASPWNNPQPRAMMMPTAPTQIIAADLNDNGPKRRSRSYFELLWQRGIRPFFSWLVGYNKQAEWLKKVKENKARREQREGGAAKRQKMM